jgi:Fibronectin type III-like domain/Glycosyl hydrolase family 3 C-terminal domain
LTTPGGQYAGEAIAQVLFGEYNPSGRLPFTIAKDDSEYVPIVKSYPRNGRPQDDIPSGLYFDYRYYDMHHKVPRYEFGYGLSFSDWTISDITVEQQGDLVTSSLPVPPAYQALPSKDESLPSAESLLFPDDLERIDYYTYSNLENVEQVEPHGEYPYPPHYSDKQAVAPSLPGGGSGGNPALWEVVYKVSLDVTNEGPYHGGFVPQIYLGFPQSHRLPTPPRQLRGFDKVFSDAGETTTSEFELLRRDISLWDTESQTWVVLPGKYKVYGCSSSRDCQVTATFTI